MTTLRDGTKWQRYVGEVREQSVISGDAAERALKLIATWVKSGGALCRHISEKQIAMALARGLVTLDEVQALGFMR